VSADVIALPPRTDRHRLAADPQGRNAKNRPCVIVSHDDHIESGSPLAVIGVTSTLTGLDPTDRVDLPFSNDPAHPSSTGLSRPSAAVCSWQDVVEQDDVLAVIGLVPTEQLERIVSRLRQIVEARQVAKPPDSGNLS
jgi:mRNA-degrading endonuclease toxin of MazEF toxin-antitoxin module